MCQSAEDMLPKCRGYVPKCRGCVAKVPRICIKYADKNVIKVPTMYGKSAENNW